MKKSKGFTLIEVAIVLLVVAFALGSFLIPLGSRMEDSREKTALTQLDEIKQAIIHFAIVNNRLPCPDTNQNGQENFNIVTGLCTNVLGRGWPPVVDLGLGLSKQLDPWGQRVIYRMDTNFADWNPAPNWAGTGCGTANPNVSFEICSIGTHWVWQEVAQTNQVARQVPVILLSTGRLGGLTSPEESENTNANRIFIKREKAGDNAVIPFNDIVVWISGSELAGNMVKAGRLP